MSSFAAALSTRPDTETAVEEVCRKIVNDLEGHRADLAVLFMTAHHVDDAELIVDRVRAALEARNLIGCTAEGVLCGEAAREGEAGLTLWAAELSGVEIESYHVSYERARDGGYFSGWPDLDRVDEGSSVIVLLADPFSLPVHELISRIDEDHPGGKVVGGMASSGATPMENRLIVGGEVVTEGGVGVVLRSGSGIKTIVSQGCRPIGKPFVVTACHENVILSLGGRPALEKLSEVVVRLDKSDQRLVRRGLHVGQVIDEYQSDFGPGDFLIRNVMGIDRRTGAIGVTDRVRRGQTIQFQVRDARSADEELRGLLRDVREGDGDVGGALLFTCNGRGSHMFPKANHDIEVVQKMIGPLPAAGFYAAGEIGPVSGRSFIHGFTASMVLFGDEG